MKGVFLSIDIFAVDIAAFDMADKTTWKTASTAKEETKDPASQALTGTVGMSRWFTANTFAYIGISFKEY